VNLLEYNKDTIKGNTETLNYASKEVGLEINVEKTKYMLLVHHQNAGQNHDIKLANRSFENVSQLKNFGMTVWRLSLTIYKNTTALTSDTQPLLAAHITTDTGNW
jgi:hypothetical protein